MRTTANLEQKTPAGKGFDWAGPRTVAESPGEVRRKKDSIRKRVCATQSNRVAGSERKKRCASPAKPKASLRLLAFLFPSFLQAPLAAKVNAEGKPSQRPAQGFCEAAGLSSKAPTPLIPILLNYICPGKDTKPKP